MSTDCDLCGGSSLTQVYAASPSGRGLTVWLCSHCGLLQSLPRVDRAERRPAKVSGGADWGNLRYGKGFRADANLEILRPFLPERGSFTVLDIGANRGAFAQSLFNAFPQAHLTGLEPDERVVDAWKSHPQATWVHSRLEETNFAPNRFDFVYSCHTLEHLRSARLALELHYQALKVDGLLFIEVPNIDVLASADIVEEFFIDKHLYHFSRRTLAQLLSSCGFRAIAISDPTDRTNIGVVARRVEERKHVAADTDEVQRTSMLVADYGISRLQNIAALAGVAKIIYAMSPRRVALWGAGRLLHSLIENGGLQASALSAVVDKNLIRYATEAHGIPLTAPEQLSALKPDVVVVMSRSFADEIRREAKSIVPGCEVVVYGDLLEQAKAARAASERAA